MLLRRGGNLITIKEGNEVLKNRIDRLILDRFEQMNRCDSVEYIESVTPAEMILSAGGVQKIKIQLTKEQIVNVLRHQGGTLRAPVHHMKILMRIGVVILGGNIHFKRARLHCSVKLNGEQIKFPETGLINLTPDINTLPNATNSMIIRFEFPNFYVIKIFLGKTVGTPDLEMKYNPTLMWLENRLSGVNDPQISSINMSLICPISMRLITCPCRAEECKHFSCFDLSSFLNIYLNKRTWICPVCGNYIKRNSIYIDRLILKMLQQLSAGATHLTVTKDSLMSCNEK